MEEAKGTPGVTITDEEKALALYRSVARLAASGEDEEREAIQAEERGRVMDLAAHRRTIEGLLRAASPVASLPGAVRCQRCGAGVWVSPSWPGPRPTLCRECEREGAAMSDRDLMSLIRALLKARPGRAWTGTVADLLAALRLDTREPRALGKRLHRNLPHLAAAGIEMSFSRRGKKRTRIITIHPAADMSVPTLPPRPQALPRSRPLPRSRAAPQGGILRWDTER